MPSEADLSPETWRRGVQPAAAVFEPTPLAPSALLAQAPLQPQPSGSESGPDAQQTSSRERKSFEFITNEDEDGRKKARAHVMRDFMRRKRSRKGTSPQPSSSESLAFTPGGGLKLRWRNTNPRPSQDDGSKTNDSERPEPSTMEGEHRQSLWGVDPVPNAPVSAAELGSNYSQTILVSDQSRHTIPGPTNPGFPSTLGGGPLDPFDFPFPLGPADHKLIHHYVSVLPSSMFGMANLNKFNPFNQTFRLLGKNYPVACQTILAVAAHHSAALYGETDGVRPTLYKQRLVEILKDTLQANKGLNPIMGIFAAMGLADIEDRWGSTQEAQMHHYYALYILKTHGGVDELRHHRMIERMMWWTDFTIRSDPSSSFSPSWLSEPSGVCTVGYPDGLSVPAPPPKPDEGTVSDYDDAVLVYTEFCAYLRSLMWLAIQTRRQHEQQGSQPLPTHISYPLNPQVIEPKHLRRVETFAPQSPLRRLLTSSPADRPNLRPGSTFIQEYCRMACLLYLNTAIWDFRADPMGLDVFLKDLSIQLVDNELDWNNSLETLLWICLLADDQFGSEKRRSLRLWFVGRMLRAVKRADDTMWKRIRDLLLAILILSDEIQDSQQLPWENEDLRRVIIAGFTPPDQSSGDALGF